MRFDVSAVSNHAQNVGLTVAVIVAAVLSVIAFFMYLPVLREDYRLDRKHGRKPTLGKDIIIFWIGAPMIAYCLTAVIGIGIGAFVSIHQYNDSVVQKIEARADNVKVLSRGDRGFLGVNLMITFLGGALGEKVTPPEGFLNKNIEIIDTTTGASLTCQSYVHDRQYLITCQNPASAGYISVDKALETTRKNNS